MGAAEDISSPTTLRLAYAYVHMLSLWDGYTNDYLR